MNLNSILAVSDLSPAGNQAIDRAAMLAVEHDAVLRLMYAVALDHSQVDAAACLRRMADQTSRRFGVTVQAVSRTAEAVEQLAQEARHDDLLVISHRREPLLSALFRGARIERLTRLSRCPVLVTKLEARKRYGRILVAVDFTDTSKALANLALGLDADAEVELFHAISTRDEAKLRSAEATDHAIKAYRDRTRFQAHERMLWLTDSFDARRNRVMSAIGRGDPARQAAVQQEYRGADLIVVGKRRRSAVADFFCGSVAQRLLPWATSDVLVVPHDHC